jgi:hypothetical protein
MTRLQESHESTEGKELFVRMMLRYGLAFTA